MSSGILDVHTLLQHGIPQPRFTVEQPSTISEGSCQEHFLVRVAPVRRYHCSYSGLLAYGIGHLDGSLGYRGWRYIYVIEGVFSFLVGLIAIFTLQDTPQKTKKWLSTEDKRFLELRTKFMYGGGGMGAKNEFRWPDVVKAMKVCSSSPHREIWKLIL